MTLLLLPTAAFRRWALALSGWALLTAWACRAWRRWWGFDQHEEEERASRSRARGRATTALLGPVVRAVLAAASSSSARVDNGDALGEVLIDEGIAVALDAAVGGVGAWLASGGGWGGAVMAAVALRSGLWALALLLLWFPLSAWAWRESRRSGVSGLQALGLTVASHALGPFLIAAGAFL